MVDWCPRQASPGCTLFSGPAGGVIGFSQTCFDADEQTPVIGFDMGGTSTDVSRYDGELDHIFETTTAGIAIQAPQLNVNTIAAGGGNSDSSALYTR
ncbi:hypothetical protein N7537_001231 [Penicillium hordei]|uniref:Hydantoinase A/oxoprolinase domain-containing protein n=1 Tax=Penicillium hordei TaxID=40994 RepID=A0AAD6EF44_9EURO|nr:uncharacterized protein N7537_001231 [Penicillium hordei]KAJ5616117.1 hypothetical protein N7537_001231 [Penicillium hordei]